MKLSTIVTLIIFAGFIYLAKDNLYEKDQQSTNESSPYPITYATQATNNSWPIIDQSQISIADNLNAKNYYLVFDGSGSMQDHGCSNGQRKINVAKSSVINFISKIPDNANLGLTIFDSYGVSERTALSINSKTQTIEAIRQTSAGGGTPLKTTISHAYNALTQQAKKQLGYGEYHLIVITDGQANEREDPDHIVETIILKSPVVLHTIGFCISGGHPLNQPGLTLYKAANNPKELEKGLDSVLAEANNFDTDTFTE